VLRAVVEREVLVLRARAADPHHEHGHRQHEPRDEQDHADRDAEQRRRDAEGQQQRLDAAAGDVELLAGGRAVPFSAFVDVALYDQAQGFYASGGRAGGRGAPHGTTAVLLGDIFAKRGLYGEALERYREARAAAPDDPDATLGEIRALLALGWAGDAAPLADELANRVRGDVEVLVARARVRLAVGDALGALDCIREAQVLAPGRPDLFHLQAQVSSRLGDRSAALAAFNREMDPAKRKPLWANIQRLLYEQASTLITGHFYSLTAVSDRLQGFTSMPQPAFWNVRLAQ